VGLHLHWLFIKLFFYGLEILMFSVNCVLGGMYEGDLMNGLKQVLDQIRPGLG